MTIKMPITRKKKIWSFNYFDIIFRNWNLSWTRIGI